VLVAERDDKPVGFVSIHLGEETSSIGLIGVSADHRGRGVGQELVSSAVNWAKAQKRPEITVVTQGRNVAAQRCFQRAGFLTSRTELWFHGRFT
jgi:dTDP-4-amino-4,6-dideoxy-D-galactose acyltransferase